MDFSISKGLFNGKLLTLVYLAVFLLVSTACFSLVAPAPTANPPADPAAPSNSGPRPAAYELELIADPREGADFIVNPKANAQGAYTAGTAATIDVLLRPGWSIEQWVGPVYAVAGETAKVNMDQDQTVLVRMIQASAPPTPTPTPTPLPTATPKPDRAYALIVNRQQVTGPILRLAHGGVKADPEPNAP